MLYLSLTTRNEEECFVAAICAAYCLHLVTRLQLALTACRQLNEDRRSGALEALLVTPITEQAWVAAYHESLQQSVRAPFATVLGMNLALELAVIGGYEKLHMRGGAWAVFSAFFIGGALITMTDFRTLRWLCLHEAFKNATQMRAVGRAFGRFCLLGWPTFGLACLLAVQFRNEEAAALVFLAWALGCVAYNLAVVAGCRRWLNRGLRRRASEC